MQLTTYPADQVPDWTVVTDTGQTIFEPRARADIHDATGALRLTNSDSGSVIRVFAHGAWKQVMPSW